MIRSVHMKSCLAAQKRFLLFKGPGSFKQIFLIGGNVEDLYAYRLIPRTPALPGHFSVPLTQIFLAFKADLGWLHNVSGLFLSTMTNQNWTINNS
jgi:hypothetical protein